MKQVQIKRAARGTISLFALMAWLLAANHCIVADLLPKQAAAPAGHEHCAGQTAPSDDKKSEGCDGSSCCKALSAPLALAKSLVQPDAFFLATRDFPATSGFDLGEPHFALIAELDTGPPGSSSFAELVLQRSILAHAPPIA